MYLIFLYFVIFILPLRQFFLGRVFLVDAGRLPANGRRGVYL